MTSEKEKMLAGELYLANDEQLVRERRRAKALCRSDRPRGSVVTRDLPANCVAVGNPCRVVRSLE